MPLPLVIGGALLYIAYKGLTRGENGSNADPQAEQEVGDPFIGPRMESEPEKTPKTGGELSSVERIENDGPEQSD